MADSTPPSSPFPIPSYPPSTDLNPTSELCPEPTSDLHPNSGEEEKLAAGSSLTTHQAKAKDNPSQNSTRVSELDGDKGMNSDDVIKRDQKSLSSPQLAAGDGDKGGLLAVPEASDVAALSSEANAANESWENLDISNGVHGSSSNVSLDENAELDASVREAMNTDLEVELGSVRVTEWNVAHSLKLRDNETLRPGVSKEERNEENEDESDVQNERKQLRNEVLSDSSSSKPSSPPPGIAIVGSPRSSAGNGERGGANGGSGEGMDWWKDAMAESQNVTDDIDSLVEQLETDGEGSKLVGSTPLSSESHASQTMKTPNDGVINLDERPVGRGGDERGRELSSSGRRSKTGEQVAVGLRQCTGSQIT